MSELEEALNRLEAWCGDDIKTSPIVRREDVISVVAFARKKLNRTDPYDCDCIGCFNRASGDAWGDYNEGKL